MLLFISTLCFAQKKDTSIVLSAFEKAKVIGFKNLLKELQNVQIESDKRTKDYYQFLSDFIFANKIDASIISTHPDSLKFIDNKFHFIFKKSKTK